MRGQLPVTFASFNMQKLEKSLSFRVSQAKKYLASAGLHDPYQVKSKRGGGNRSLSHHRTCGTAAGFLQTSPFGDTIAFRQRLVRTTSVMIFHPLASPHAGRTNKIARRSPEDLDLIQSSVTLDWPGLKSEILQRRKWVPSPRLVRTAELVNER